MRLSCVLALLLSGSSAWARPVPLPQGVSTLVDQAPSVQRSFSPPPSHLLSAPPFQSTDIQKSEVQASVDPTTGQASGTVTIVVKAITTVSQLGMFIDQGLNVTSAVADAGTVTPFAQAAPPLRYVTLSLSPPLAAGEERSITVSYDGTLACSATGASFNQGYCNLSGPLGLLMEGSAIPGLYDQEGLGGYNLWGAESRLTLHLPTGTDAVSGGDKTLDSDDGTTRTFRWDIPGYHTAGPRLVLFGDLSEYPVSGTSPPTTVFLPQALPKWSGEMQDWMTTILPFLEEQTQSAMPFKDLSVLKLPAQWTLPGTAGHGYVLLAENYGDYGAEYFEETLAHETAHEWWGILIAPTDFMFSRWLTEGMATVTQIDYASAHHAHGLPRDRYLARRYNEHGLLLRYTAAPDLPPAIITSPEQAPQDSVQNTLWAYIRTSAAIEHLRVAIGEDAFNQALGDYVAQCHDALCDTDDFRTLLETRSGRSLAGFFDTFLRTAAVPRPVIGFSQSGGQLSIQVQGSASEIPVELGISYLDGSTETRRVDLPATGNLTLDVEGAVLAVRPNRRHDAIVWSRSAQAGDVDFDGEVDGLDLMHCARQVGKSASFGQPGGEGLWRLDLDFDARCDANEDGAIDETDLAPQQDNFATLRKDTP